MPALGSPVSLQMVKGAEANRCTVDIQYLEKIQSQQKIISWTAAEFLGEGDVEMLSDKNRSIAGFPICWKTIVVTGLNVL